jgi:hypothetical protein
MILDFRFYSRRKKEEGRRKKEEAIKAHVSVIKNVLTVWPGCYRLGNKKLEVRD